MLASLELCPRTLWLWNGQTWDASEFELWMKCCSIGDNGVMNNLRDRTDNGRTSPICALSGACALSPKVPGQLAMNQHHRCLGFGELMTR